MVIVTGRFEMAPGDVAAFIAEKEAGMRRSRAEDGCIVYAFGADPIEAGVVNLLERWESGAALDAHIAAMRANPAPPSAIKIVSAEILRHEVSSSGPLF
jgi:quinol monooxygenase YgiN